MRMAKVLSLLKPEYVVPFHGDYSDAFFMATPLLAKVGKLTGENTVEVEEQQRVGGPGREERAAEGHDLVDEVRPALELDVDVFGEAARDTKLLELALERVLAAHLELEFRKARGAFLSNLLSRVDAAGEADQLHPWITNQWFGHFVQGAMYYTEHPSGEARFIQELREQGGREWSLFRWLQDQRSSGGDGRSCL